MRNTPSRGVLEVHNGGTDLHWFLLYVRLKCVVVSNGIVHASRGATHEQRLDLGDDCSNSRPGGGAVSPARLYHLHEPTQHNIRRSRYALYNIIEHY